VLHDVSELRAAICVAEWQLNSTKTMTKSSVQVLHRTLPWQLCARAVVVSAFITDINFMFTACSHFHHTLLQVMAQGGFKAVTQSAGWQTLALNLQRDSALAAEVAAVYSCYLLPLEQDLPYGFRPARNLDHLETRTQQRASMGPRLASYDAVAFAWQRALAALQHALPWASEKVKTTPRQQQQQDEAVAKDVADIKQQQQQQGMQCSQLVRGALLLLLRDAAVHPSSVVQQLQQHCIGPGLHASSREACIGQFRRGYASRRKAKGAAAAAVEESEWWAGDAEAAMQLFVKDQAALEAAAAAASAAATKAAAAAAMQHAGGGKRQSSSPVDSMQHQAANSAAAAAGEGASGSAEVAPEPPAKRVCTAAANSSSSSSEQQDQQQPQQSSEPDPHLQLDAIQWMLLSRRAVHSGPPGCNRPPLQLTGVQLDTSISAAASAAAAAAGDGSRGASSSALAGKRAFHGVTPKCGACQTCSNPSMKKACIVNRQRIAQGLPPILPQAAAAAAAGAAKSDSK
jgi:hypothetical protein